MKNFPTEAEVQKSFKEISAEVSLSKAFSSLPTKNNWLFLKLAAAFSILVLALAHPSRLVNRTLIAKAYIPSI